MNADSEFLVHFDIGPQFRGLAQGDLDIFAFIFEFINFLLFLWAKIDGRLKKLSQPNEDVRSIRD